MNYEALRREVAIVHQKNTIMVVELLNRDSNLSHLDTIFDPVVAEIYQRLLPRLAELCEINGDRPLTEAERCELAVSYASLYPTFGQEGIIIVTAHWFDNRPNRQSRDN